MELAKLYSMLVIDEQSRKIPIETVGIRRSILNVFFVFLFSVNLFTAGATRASTQLVSGFGRVKDFSSTVLPVYTNPVCSAWPHKTLIGSHNDHCQCTQSGEMKKRLKATKSSFYRCMLGISQTEHVSNVEVRPKTSF